MNAEELLQEWESDEEDEPNGLRPARIKRLRDDIMEITGKYVPRRPSEIESWLEQQKPQITRKIRAAAGVYDEESDESGEESEDDA